MPTEREVLDALKGVMDPELGKDIVSLGFIKELMVTGGKVSFSVELTTPACPLRGEIEANARRAAASVGGVTEVDVKMTARVRGPMAAAGLPGVKNVIPVASGKGGVGKSTVTANLAVSLARAGARVGIMDADVYGPSIPLLMGVEGEPAVKGDKLVPPEAYGVKIMSIGFFAGETEAVVWRGPMLHGVVKQFLEQVEWGELDYLLVDLPPGTGDIQLSLSQMLCFTGAVIVSTPQDAALRVARKAVSMFQKLDRPILGFVENMSYFTCPHCGKREDIFGHGGAKAAAEEMGIPFLGEIPLATAVRTASDAGKPVVVAEPGSPLAKAFDAVATAVASTASIRSAVSLGTAASGG